MRRATAAESESSAFLLKARLLDGFLERTDILGAGALAAAELIAGARKVAFIIFVLFF